MLGLIFLRFADARFSARRAELDRRPRPHEVKKVASKLLAKLRGIFTIDWQRTTQARARVRDAIEETLG